MSTNTAFACERCGYCFTTKQSRIVHYKKKTPCEPKIKDVSIESCLAALEDEDCKAL